MLTDHAKSPGQVNITLDGVLVPHNDSSDELASLSKLFTAYLNGDTSPVVATGRSVLLPPNNQSISWLTEGVTALSLNVPFKNPTVDGPLGPIKSITIGDMALEFNASDPWAPLTTTRSVQAFMRTSYLRSLSKCDSIVIDDYSPNQSFLSALASQSLKSKIRSIFRRTVPQSQACPHR